MAQKRIKVREQVEEISTWEFEGPLSLILDRVEELIKQHGPDARMNFNKHFYYDYDNEPTPRYELYIEREENDAELKQRLKQIHQREEAEKAEFERLAKKYGAK